MKLDPFLEPETKLVGAPEMFLDTSSTLNLTCIVSWTSSPPDEVSWYHNQSQVSILGPRGGVSLMVDKSRVTQVTLMLQQPTVEDSGFYECRPNNAPSAYITIHILEGEMNK